MLRYVLVQCCTVYYFYFLYRNMNAILTREWRKFLPGSDSVMAWSILYLAGLLSINSGWSYDSNVKTLWWARYLIKQTWSSKVGGYFRLSHVFILCVTLYHTTERFQRNFSSPSTYYLRVFVICLTDSNRSQFVIIYSHFPLWQMWLVYILIKWKLSRTSLMKFIHFLVIWGSQS